MTTDGRDLPRALVASLDGPFPPSDEPGVPDGYAPEISRIVNYWRRIHPNEGPIAGGLPTGELPGRQHLDPIDIPELLPHVWLTDVTSDPRRFRMRLVGTAIVKYAGRDSTGQWMTDLFPSFEQSDGYRDMVTCVEQKIPVYRTAKRLAAEGARQSQRVHLPLATDGRTVDMLLSVTRYVLVDA